MDKEGLSLRKEIDYFVKHVSDLIARYGEGRFILIREGAELGPFDTREKAYEEGVKQFGLKPFLIERLRKLDSDDAVDYIPALDLGVLFADY